MIDVLALVTARGGSKGIPGKNIVPFLERPLLDWSVLAAQKSEKITRVIVTTDDEQIAECARSAGAETPFLRPPELAQDDTLDLPVFQHALNWLSDQEGYKPELVVHLRPTSPLRPPGLIDSGIDLMRTTSLADSLRAVCLPTNNPYKMWLLEDDRPFMTPFVNSGFDEPYNQPRQALPTAYWQIGVLDVIKSETILRKNSMTGDRILPLIVDSSIAVDIDDPASLAHAEGVCRQARIEDLLEGAIAGKPL
jgi:N-acylneuraminate cytidylyltransferase